MSGVDAAATDNADKAATAEDTKPTNGDNNQSAAPDQSEKEVEKPAAEAAAAEVGKEEEVTTADAAAEKDDGAVEADQDVAGEDGDDEDAEDVAEEGPKPPDAAADGVKLGYRVFKNKGQALDYFHNILNKMPLNADLNEFEHRAVHDLLLKGHHSAESKVGVGIRSFQVRRYPTEEKQGSKCFYVVRTDGSAEDFSLLKCLTNLFDAWTDGPPALKRQFGRSRGGPNKFQKRNDGERGDGHRGGRRFTRGRGRFGRRGGRR